MNSTPGQYLPILDPGDPASLPATLPPTAPSLVPLRPDRRRRAAGRRWIRQSQRRFIGHFCLSDHTLAALERRDPLGLRLALDAGVEQIITMDTPLYDFFTPAQAARANAVLQHRLLRTLERAPRLGLEAVPLVKALEAATLDVQLDLVQEAGLFRAAFYARELLLEHDIDLLRRFVRGAHRRRIRPLLLGAFSARLQRWGPTELAARHHYVLARRGEELDANGRTQRLTEARYSPLLGRFLLPGDRAGLCAHNYLQARQRIASFSPPAWFGG